MVDELELVEVDFQHGVLAVVFVRLVQRAARPGLESGPVDQARQRVVSSPVAHLAQQAALRGHIVEDQDHVEDLATRVTDRRRRLLDAQVLAAARDEQRVVGRADDLALLQARGYEVFRGLAALLVDDVENMG